MSRRIHWPTVRSQAKRLFGWTVVVVVILFAAAVVFLGTPYEPPAETVQTVEADEEVTLSAYNGGYLLEPAAVDDADRTDGLVFYPGARVEPSGYVESLAPLASEANLTVVIPKMPTNLAVTDYAIARTGLRADAATRAMNDHDAIENWYIGGHSMGGAMACRYARSNADALDGLLLYASYCDQDISDSDLAVLSVAGEADTVLTWDTYERNLANLPADATVETLPDVNHTQFGSYRFQRGDDPSGTSYEEAHQRLNDVVLAWFESQRRG